MRALFLPLCLCAAHVVAQPTYVVKHGLPAGTQVRASDRMPDGGLVLAGAVNNQQHYVNRLDAAGNSIWAQTISMGGSHGVVGLPDGKVMIVGHRGTWESPPPPSPGLPRSYVLLDTDGQIIYDKAHSNSAYQVTWRGAEGLSSGHAVIYDGYNSLFGTRGMLVKVDPQTGDIVNSVTFRRTYAGMDSWFDRVLRLRPRTNNDVVAMGSDYVAGFSSQMAYQWHQYFDRTGLVDLAVNANEGIHIAWTDVLMRLTSTGVVEQTLGIPASMGTIAALKPTLGGGVIIALNASGGAIRWGHMAADGTMLWLEEWGEPGLTYTVEDIHTHPDGRLTIVAIAGGSEPVAAIITTNVNGQVPGCSNTLSPPALLPATVDLLDYQVELGGGGYTDYLYPSNYWSTGLVSGAQELCETGFGRLSGSVYLDVDADGEQDAEDLALAMRPVHIEPTGQVFFSSSEGFDADVLNTGLHTVSLLHDPAIWGVAEGDGGYALDITEVDTIITGLDFGLVPILDTVDVQASLTSASARCFWPVPQQIDLVNMGTLAPDLVVSLTLDPLISFSSSTPAPDSIVGNEIFWHVDQLALFGTASIHLMVFTPGFQYMDAVLQSTVRTYTIGDDGALVPAGPQYDWSSILTCAYDPNDKQVEPRGYGTDGWMPVDTEWLTYTVRFQNTGTDTAMNVVIRDQLDQRVEHTSLQVLGASHALTALDITGGGLASFHFDNILLPDSGTNEPASQGYVRFRVRVTEGTPHATLIQNTAAILFDQNPPIVTNTVRNTLVDCQVLEDGLSLTGSSDGMLKPNQGWENPIDWLYLEGNTYSWYRDGELLPPLIWENDTLPGIVADAPGTYQLVVTTGFGCVITSPTYVYAPASVSEQGQADVRVMPNPFTDEVMLVSSVKMDHLELVDVNGRVVHAQRVNTQGVQRMERGGLAPGLYVLRLLWDGQVVGTTRVVAE